MVPELLALKNVHHFFIDCSQQKEDSMNALRDLFETKVVGGQSIVFFETKVAAQMLAEGLRRDGYSVSLLSGNLIPQQRDDVMRGFHNKQFDVLITTNISARGIDCPNVNLVINYNVPVAMIKGNSFPNAQTYVHRTGRAGRFQRKGFAVTLITSPKELNDLRAICDCYQISLDALPKEFDLMQAKLRAVE